MASSLRELSLTQEGPDGIDGGREVSATLQTASDSACSLRQVAMSSESVEPLSIHPAKSLIDAGRAATNPRQTQFPTVRRELLFRPGLQLRLNRYLDLVVCAQELFRLHLVQFIPLRCRSFVLVPAFHLAHPFLVRLVSGAIDDDLHPTGERRDAAPLSKFLTPGLPGDIYEAVADVVRAPGRFSHIYLDPRRLVCNQCRPLKLSDQFGTTQMVELFRRLAVGQYSFIGKLRVLVVRPQGKS